MTRSASLPCSPWATAVNAALGAAFDDAEARLLARFGEVTLAMLSEDFHRRFAAHGGAHDLETVHAR
jgi:hypothetical protein